MEGIQFNKDSIQKNASIMLDIIKDDTTGKLNGWKENAINLKVSDPYLNKQSKRVKLLKKSSKMIEVADHRIFNIISKQYPKIKLL
mmetsp:Transcript_12523/g.11078  ORF Transcript_12523/g.11078 Transcript_12523/m.11078 type:complete len:86 (+) Transcript_12523:531-788(+)